VDNELQSVFHVLILKEEAANIRAEYVHNADTFFSDLEDLITKLKR
jgi:hypothetical protein